jgi:glycosyltransferase involved in cell wall biosynthesis
MVHAALAAGHRAVYVERPLSRSPYARKGRASLCRRGELRRAADGPEVLSVPKKRSLGPIRYSLGAARDERKRGRWLAEALSRELGQDAETIGIVTSARWWPAVRDLGLTHLVYDKNDEPQVLKGPLSEPEYLRRERELLERADLLVAPSRSLLRAGLAVRPEIPSKLVRNGVEWDVFMERRDDPVPEFEEIEEPIVGFLGTVASWIDADLIAACAAAYPDCYFPVVGRVGSGVDVSRVLAQENTAVWGPVPFRRVPGIMNRFDVCLIPFRPGPVSESACPVKFFEYLALGKPIVCTPMPELEDLEPLFHMTRDGFVDAVGRAMDETGDDLPERRRAAAREYGWDRLFRRIMEALPSSPAGNSP